MDLAEMKETPEEVVEQYIDFWTPGEIEFRVRESSDHHKIYTWSSTAEIDLPSDWTEENHTNNISELVYNHLDYDDLYTVAEYRESGGRIELYRIDEEASLSLLEK